MTNGSSRRDKIGRLSDTLDCAMWSMISPFPAESNLLHQCRPTPASIRLLRFGWQSEPRSGQSRRCTVGCELEICKGVQSFTLTTAQGAALGKYSPTVLVEVAFRLKCESAERAGIRSLVSVCSDVLLKYRWLCTVQLTVGADVAAGRGAGRGDWHGR